MLASLQILTTCIIFFKILSQSQPDNQGPEYGDEDCWYSSSPDVGVASVQMAPEDFPSNLRGPDCTRWGGVISAMYRPEQLCLTTMPTHVPFSLPVSAKPSLDKGRSISFTSGFCHGC